MGTRGERQLPLVPRTEELIYAKECPNHQSAVWVATKNSCRMLAVASPYRSNGPSFRPAQSDHATPKGLLRLVQIGHVEEETTTFTDPLSSVEWPTSTPHYPSGPRNTRKRQLAAIGDLDTSILLLACTNADVLLRPRDTPLNQHQSRVIRMDSHNCSALLISKACFKKYCDVQTERGGMD